MGGGIERLCPLAAAPPARRSPNMAAALRRSFASEKRPPHKRSVPPPAPHPPPATRMDVGGPQPPLGVRHRLGRLCPKGGGGRGGTFRPRGGESGGVGKLRQCRAVQRDVGMRYGAVQWEIKARYGAVQWEIKARYGAVLMPPSPVRGWVPPLGTNIYPVGQKGFGTTPGSIAAIGPRPHCVRLGSPHGEVGGGG